MESFNQKMTQELDVKSEVSDAAFQSMCEKSDDESLSSSTPDNAKRSFEDEQDSSLDQGPNGSPLPPRKRAKTQEEKEQRRIERIMRNRQAAHASREKKRKHLETLESRCSELESENMKLRRNLAHQDEARERLAQLEAAIRLAKSSGNLSALDSVLVAQPEGPELSPPSLHGTVAGTVAGARPLADSVSSTTSSTGSPAPSLEEDCASPDAFFIKSEELFAPNSPDKVNADAGLDDPFGIMNFSFDPNPASTYNPAYPDGSSKSRHPAALTPLSRELINAPIEY